MRSSTGRPSIPTSQVCRCGCLQAVGKVVPSWRRAFQAGARVRRSSCMCACNRLQECLMFVWNSFVFGCSFYQVGLTCFGQTRAGSCVHLPRPMRIWDKHLRLLTLIFEFFDGNKMDCF